MKQSKKHIDLNFFIDSSCENFKIDNVLNSSLIQTFKNKLSDILEEKLQHIIQKINVNDLKIICKWSGVSYLNLYKFDDMLISFTINFYDAELKIGSVNNHGKFTIHKHDILDVEKEESGFVKSKGDIIDSETDLFKRLKALPYDEFILEHSIVINRNEIHESENFHINCPIPIYEKFINDLFQVIKYLNKENIYIIESASFQYEISKTDSISIFFHSNSEIIVEIFQENIDYSNDEEFKHFIFNILNCMEIIPNEIFDNSENKSYKEIFELIKLIEY